MKKFLYIFLQVLAVASPIWLPLLGGYLFDVYALFFNRAPRSIVEPTILVLAVLSLFCGLFVVVLNTRKNIIGMIATIIVYIVVASFVAFFTGWGGMLIGGYGN